MQKTEIKKTADGVYQMTIKEMTEDDIRSLRRALKGFPQSMADERNNKILGDDVTCALAEVD